MFMPTMDYGGLSTGRISDLFASETVRCRVLGFQKVQIHDERIKIQQALGGSYPAEVHGSDAKNN